MELSELLEFLEQEAPMELAESWDNVGLLWGQASRDVQRVITCLTLTPDVAHEAVTEQADLIVTHHPVLFRPVQRLTSETAQGAMLLELAAAGIGVYSPHTGYDSGPAGINQQWGERLGLSGLQPLRLLASDEPAESLGAGRWGTLPAAESLGDFLKRVGQAVPESRLQFVGSRRKRVECVGVACGAAAEFLVEAQAVGCDVLVTGEARFHDCLDARTRGIALVLTGHYASERFAMETLAERLGERFERLTVWASRSESDPVRRA